MVALKWFMLCSPLRSNGTLELEVILDWGGEEVGLISLDFFFFFPGSGCVV